MCRRRPANTRDTGKLQASPRTIRSKGQNDGNGRMPRVARLSILCIAAYDRLLALPLRLPALARLRRRCSRERGGCVDDGCSHAAETVKGGPRVRRPTRVEWDKNLIAEIARIARGLFNGAERAANNESGRAGAVEQDFERRSGESARRAGVDHRFAFDRRCARLERSSRTVETRVHHRQSLLPPGGKQRCEVRLDAGRAVRANRLSRAGDDKRPVRWQTQGQARRGAIAQ